MSAGKITPEQFAAAVAMSDDELRGFLEGRWLCKFAVVKRDGSPAVGPVWYEHDGEAFWVTTFAATLKARAIERDDRVALCIDTDVPVYKAVLVQGRASLVRDDVVDITRRIYTRYLGPEKGPAHLEEVLDVGEGDLVIIKVVPTGITSWNYERDPIYEIR